MPSVEEIRYAGCGRHIQDVRNRAIANAAFYTNIQSMLHSKSFMKYGYESMKIITVDEERYRKETKSLVIEIRPDHSNPIKSNLSITAKGRTYDPR